MTERHTNQAPELLETLERIRASNGHLPDLMQALDEIARSVGDVLRDHPEWQRLRVLERLVEPDRLIQFRVEWEDDDRRLHLERGYRVQQSCLLGPYKGGLRFHPTVNSCVLRFLAFEQTFKDALTGMALGGAKGGATFDPRGRSDREILRFCRAFMVELSRHVGPSLDVPAGDIGVGVREIGFLYGALRRVRPTGEGVLTGKGPLWAGIPLRTEATGYGAVYFLRRALRHHDRALEGARVLVSGAGNVARHAAARAVQHGARVLTLSNSDGALLSERGFTEAQIQEITDARREGARLDDMADRFDAEWRSGDKPWSLVDAEIAMPCATQNELDEVDAERLIERGVGAVACGANMPCTKEAVRRFEDADEVIFLPGKVANAGGVIVSGLEMAQNASRRSWTRDEVEDALHERMDAIHDRCVEHGGDARLVDYARGANIASFMRLASAMESQGF